MPLALGPVDPARSRHAGRRSAVALLGDVVVAGTADGDVVGVDRATETERWRWRCDREATSVVAATPFAGGVLVGERGPAGAVRLHDADGSVRWERETAETVGPPAREGRFFRPFVVGLAAADGRAVVAARRYERDGDARRFESVVAAFAPDGEAVWRRRADASPVALDADADRVAVAYNRCPPAADHEAGLLLLDAADGSGRLRWDPPGDGPRRVGDVALLSDGVAVASHADYRGYRLSGAGDVRWGVDLGTRVTKGETVYAYPNHVHATGEGVVFVTGNTYPEEGRETAVRHPRANAALGYAPDGTARWSASVGGFASGVAADGRRVAVPGAQAFRDRDPETHGLRTFDVREGPRAAVGADGVVTAAAVRGDALAWVEEPVVYHDEGKRRGDYRLHASTWGNP